MEAWLRPARYRRGGLQTELQLVVIQSFGAPTQLAALQLLNEEPEAFDPRLRLSEVGAFGRERPDHPLQRLHIVWQIGKINVHEPEVYADSRASSPIHMPVNLRRWPSRAGGKMGPDPGEP